MNTNDSDEYNRGYDAAWDEARKVNYQEGYDEGHEDGFVLGHEECAATYTLDKAMCKLYTSREYFELFAGGFVVIAITTLAIGWVI